MPVILALWSTQILQFNAPREKPTMYSIVMMTALTSAPDAPQFNGYFRDIFSRDSNGCNGCSGGPRYSCYGGSCSGAAAYPMSCNGCNGCNGGSAFGLGMGDRVRSFFDRDSGSGCCGSRAYGCSGASFSCSGYSCNGSAYSCFGGPTSYTPTSTGGLSCQGGLLHTTPPAFDQFPPYPGQPGIPYAVPDSAPGSLGLRPAAHASPASNAQTGRAAVVVKLPADARLSADGRALNLTGAERKFVSPELPLNQEFVYRFKVEYERDGETVSVTKRVPVHAGATVTVEFADLTAAKATTPAPGKTTSATPLAPVPQEPAKTEPPVREAPATPGVNTPGSPANDRATITVKLPPGATLYVDDRKSPSKEAVRQFATPLLPAGREFAYLIKAEIVRDGQPETLTQKVPFRAGERIVVDFTSLGSK